VLAVNETLDIALLAVPDLTATPIAIACIDRQRIEVVRDVMAAGFPNYKYSADKPRSTRRQPAQPVGSVGTVEDLSAGTLTLKLEAGEPAPVPTAEGSPWEGLSGAGVIVREALLGIAIEHCPAEGLGSIRFVPFTQLSTLVPGKRALFCALLDIVDPDTLPPVNSASLANVRPDVAADLIEITRLEEQGLLLRVEARNLRILAYKKAKGWSK
jgi:hypothetical protein